MTKTLVLKKMPTVLPQMIVFDLDYTLWSEWIDCTYGPPYKYDAKYNEVTDKQGETLALFKHTTAILALIKSFPDTKIGIASRTETPEWARQILGLLRIPELNNTTLIENVDYFEMYPGSKLNHFKALSEKSGIPCESMMFFDDEPRNKEVSRLGVHFNIVNTRTGITPIQFENALHDFASRN